MQSTYLSYCEAESAFTVKMPRERYRRKAWFKYVSFHFFFVSQKYLRWNLNAVLQLIFILLQQKLKLICERVLPNKPKKLPRKKFSSFIVTSKV